MSSVAVFLHLAFLSSVIAFNITTFEQTCKNTSEVDDFDKCLSCYKYKFEDDLEDIRKLGENGSINTECLILIDCEFKKFDSSVFRQFQNLRHLEIYDGNMEINIPSEMYKTLKNLRIEGTKISGELQGLNFSFPNLTTLTLDQIKLDENLDSGYKALYKGLNQLKSLTLSGFFKKFPEDLPSSLEDLSISEFLFSRISRDKFKNVTGLKKLSIYAGNIEEINDDAFYDLHDLAELDLEYNKLTGFDSRYLKENKNLKGIALDPLEKKDLKDIGFVESSRTGYFVKEEDLADYNEDY